MGRGIPAPTPPDVNRDVGALPPVPSIHCWVTNGQKAVARHTSICERRTPCPVALNATGAVGALLMNAPGRQRIRPLRLSTWPPRGSHARASERSSPSGLRGGTGHPKPGGGGTAALFLRARPIHGDWTYRTCHTGRAFFPLDQGPQGHIVDTV
uniref:Uncharacterized protein n=2 Tax=Oryza sativa subsp. japonica TaxID=39947 RepID=Q75J12_ORYSJ|nr:hypothetical protein [Oryza sativa Japonica Group]ABF98945.1 hypothetical protein LOC_Os03g54830 [Oryza sativa Japonica Group]